MGSRVRNRRNGCCLNPSRSIDITYSSRVRVLGDAVLATHVICSHAHQRENFVTKWMLRLKFMILSVSSFEGGITPQTTQKPFLSSFRNQSYLLKEDWFSPRRCGDGGPWELLSSPNSLSRWRRRFWFWLLVSVSPLTIVLSISHRHSAFHAAGQDFQFFRFVASQIITVKRSWKGIENVYKIGNKKWT